MNAVTAVTSFISNTFTNLTDNFRLAMARYAVEQFAKNADAITDGLEQVSLEIRNFARQNQALNAVASAVVGVNATAISTYLKSESVKGSLIAALKKDASVIYKISATPTPSSSIA